MKMISIFISLSLLFFSCQEKQAETQRNAKHQIEILLDTSSNKSKAHFTHSNTTTMAEQKTPFPLDYIMGKFDPAKHKDFILIAKTHSSRTGMYLRKETYTAFKEMYDAAKADGIRFKIISATRNFATQKTIWEGKWTGKRLLEGGQNAAKTISNPTKRALKILEYSSMPSTSRHHWGTDFDLNNLTNAYFEKGQGLKEYNWLLANAAKFGFCQAYTPKGAARPDGYKEEKWHWSYLPIARQLTSQAKLVLKDENIKGFQGAETAKEIGIVNKYVLGINQECL